MRLITITIIICIGVSLLLSGCDNSSAPVSPSDAALQIELTTNPNPPQSGDVELMVIVKDTAGRPISDAQVNLKTDHTEMSGMTMEGPATSQGEGRYAIVAPFEHGGKWRVTVQVQQGSNNLSKDFDLQVQ
jgi:predicted component of type VI protein secretion system